MVQSHALSFFYLSSPDLLLGMESDPATRHIFGVVASSPSWAAPALRFAVSGSTSSNCSATSVFTRDGLFLAASTSR